MLGGAASAVIPPAAIDQYVEDPPTGPGGGGQLDTGGGANANGGNPNPQQDQAASPSPSSQSAAAQEPDGDPQDSGAPPQPSGADQSEASSEQDSDRDGAAGPVSQGGGPGPHHLGGGFAGPDPTDAKAVETSDAAGSTLPLIGYPITWWIWVILALALGALLVRGALALYAARTRA